MTQQVEGPYFDELERGQVFDSAPGVTLTDGRAAAFQAITGERLRLPLDNHLASTVCGAPVASPALVWNLAIGQSTLATHHVKANLFYRRLALLRQPLLGDTLRTTTTVVGLRENVRKEGRAPTGLAALHIGTVDQDGRPVLDFYRCAMLPLRNAAETGHADDLSSVGADAAARNIEDLIPDWDVAAWRSRTSGLDLESGTRIEVVGGDVVTSAPELARLTLNIASVHHDQRAGGASRLVYGGHTIGLALAQLTRAIPDIATVLEWESCDHVGPVREGDTLRSRITITSKDEIGVWTAHGVRIEVAADDERPVLDWRLTILG